MKRFIFVLIIILSVQLCGYSQTLTQVFVDPCSGKITTVVVPILNGRTTVVYRGQYRVVTANDITSGALQAWINELTINFPCPQATLAVQQTIANAVQQAVATATSQATAQATSSATAAAASAAASAAVSSPPPVSTPAPSSSGGGSSSSETKTETKSESSSESKSESKEESKSESKSEKKESKSSSRSQARVNPIIYSSDFTVAPAADSDISIIASLGMSQSSLMGNSSWGLSSMIWSTFNQFAVSGRYTLMNFNDGKLDNISNFGITGVYLGGTTLGFVTAASIFPFGKWGTTGANYTFSVAGADKGMNLSNNILLFYTVPVPVSKRLTISPDIYLSGSSTGYLTAQQKFITSNDIGILTGASFDIALTKRFKFNFALKTSLNTNPIVPPTYFGMIGTKINL